MATEPERPIEKLLRTAAQKRRDGAGAPFELHPVNRRILQGEVARTYPKAGRKTPSFAGLLGQLWPRLAGGLAIFAVLGMAVWLLVPAPGSGEQEAMLAKKVPVFKAMPAKPPSTSAPAAATIVASAPAPEGKKQEALVAYNSSAPVARSTAARQLSAEPQPVAPASPAVVASTVDADRFAPAQTGQAGGTQYFARKEIAASGGRPASAPAGTLKGALESNLGYVDRPASPADAASAPAVAYGLAMKPAQTPALSGDKSGTAAGALFEESAAQSKALVTASDSDRSRQLALATDGLYKQAAGSRDKARASGASQRFARVGFESKDKSALADATERTQAVLASFEVQQTGRELRIVDSDGSVYRGYLRPATAARRARAPNADSVGAAFASRAPEAEIRQQPANTPGLEAVAPLEYSFRVAGTNRSVNQQVVFTGSLRSATNLVLSSSSGTNVSIGGTLGGLSSNRAGLAVAPLLQSRISGQVVVGGGKPEQINAVPSSR